MFTVRAQLVQLHERRIYPAEITIEAGRISGIREVGALPAGAGYLLPGFVDAHVHIESSMLPPAEFARLAVVHGTVATVSDPHEIANVLGLAGVQFMLERPLSRQRKRCATGYRSRLTGRSVLWVINSSLTLINPLPPISFPTHIRQHRQ